MEGLTKMKLDHLNHDERMLNELMEFVLHDALGLNWKLDIDMEMAQVHQRKGEKIEQFI